MSSIGQYAEMERAARAVRDAQNGKDLESISCPTCDSQWFEQVVVCRFKLDHHVALGQKVPYRPNQQDFVMLKCVRCNDYLEPKISMDLRDTSSDSYGFLKETLEGKGDKREVDAFL